MKVGLEANRTKRWHRQQLLEANGGGHVWRVNPFHSFGGTFSTAKFLLHKFGIQLTGEILG